MPEPSTGPGAVTLPSRAPPRPTRVDRDASVRCTRAMSFFRGVAPFAIAAAVFLVPVCPATAQVAPAPGTPPRRRIEITFAGGVHYPVRSDYQRTLTVLDRTPFLFGATFAARGYTVPRPWIRIGARLGFLRMVSLGPADERSPSGAGADLAFDVADLAASVRLVGLVRNEHDAFRADVTADAGVAFGAATLRGVNQWLVAPIVGISGFAGYESVPDGAVVGFRMGVQYVPWNGAGGNPFDPALAGAYMMFEIGGIS